MNLICRRRIFLIAMLLLLRLPSIAQSYVLRLQESEGRHSLLPVPPAFTQASAAFAWLQSLIPSLQEQGYLAASADSLLAGDTAATAFIYLGQRFRWARIQTDSIPPALLAAAGTGPMPRPDEPLRPARLARISERLLDWCEDHGYPFARVWLDATHIDSSGGLSGRLQLERGPLRLLDTVIVTGNLRIARSFLLRYLDLKEGEPYSERRLRAISGRLRELSFLQEAAPWAVQFKFSRTELHLYLEEQKANQLNGLLGLLPDYQGSGRMLLTVDAHAAFQNILGAGERLGFSFQNLQYRSPRLQAYVEYPYLLGSPLGLEGRFDLYRLDTAFRRSSLQLGGRYQWGPADYLRLYYQSQGNRLITVDTAFVRLNRRLPPQADVQSSGVGAGLSLSRLDYRLNPRSGWQARLSGQALQRRIRPHDAVTGLRDGSGFDYSRLYDSLKLRQQLYRLTAGLAGFVPLGRALVLHGAYEGGLIVASDLFENELFQIGGFQLLRGFDELSILASQYHIGTGELRLPLDQNSYVYAFSDNGWVQGSRQGLSREGWYHGFGLGGVLQARSGLFSVSVAAGSAPGAPAQLRQSRLHFGYLAYF